MGPNLMGSAGFRHDFQDGKTVETFDNPPLGDGTPRLTGVNGDPFPLLGVSPQGGIDDAMGFF